MIRDIQRSTFSNLLRYTDIHNYSKAVGIECVVHKKRRRYTHR